jgi:hypothetical protein
MEFRQDIGRALTLSLVKVRNGDTLFSWIAKSSPRHSDNDDETGYCNLTLPHCLVVDVTLPGSFRV